MLQIIIIILHGFITILYVDVGPSISPYNQLFLHVDIITLLLIEPCQELCLDLNSQYKIPLQWYTKLGKISKCL